MATTSSRLRRPVLTTLVTTAVLTSMLIGAPAASAEVMTQNLDVLTPAQLASALVGPGVTVSGAAFTGAPVAAGTFSGGGTGAGATIGFVGGVILSSGDIASVPGPNDADGTTAANGQAGDADLDSLLPAGQTSQDAAVLTFNFTADASSVSFQYVFSSEEYNEFVGSGFNDVFGFFVNGTNCATVGAQPVSVNTVNGGNPFGTTDPGPGVVVASNPSLFRNNDLNDPGPPTIDTQMDGLTTVLTCVAPVSSVETNTMKLAIADVGDSSLDSNVFIEAGSLTTVPTVGTPTDVTAYPSDGSAIVTWTPPDQDPEAPIDSFEVTCTATDNLDDSSTVSVAGTESQAQVGGLTNGTEYTCSVRAQSGEAAGPWSDPSAPFTPSDASVAQFVDPGTGGTVILKPVGENFLGTSGRIVIPPQPTPSTLAAGDPVIVIASLFGTPGEVDVTCGGNPCVGQGIEWSISDPNAIGIMKITFIESASLTNGASVKTARVFKDNVLLPNCKKKVKIMCVADRNRTDGGGWRITVRVDGTDPKGRV